MPPKTSDMLASLIEAVDGIADDVEELRRDAVVIKTQTAPREGPFAKLASSPAAMAAIMGAVGALGPSLIWILSSILHVDPPPAGLVIQPQPSEVHGAVTPDAP